MRSVFNFLKDLPILPKLLLIPAVPIVFLLLVGVMTYVDVLNFFDDEERLNSSYLLQKTAAEYMRSVAGLETTFLGYVISKDERYLEIFIQEQTALLSFERELDNKLPSGEVQRFRELHQAVVQYVEEKNRFIQAVKAGSSTEAVRYVQAGKSRAMMVELRDWVKHFNRIESKQRNRNWLGCVTIKAGPSACC